MPKPKQLTLDEVLIDVDTLREFVLELKRLHGFDNVKLESTKYVNIPYMIYVKTLAGPQIVLGVRDMRYFYRPLRTKKIKSIQELIDYVEENMKNYRYKHLYLATLITYFVKGFKLILKEYHLSLIHI